MKILENGKVKFTWKERRDGRRSLKRARKLFRRGKNWIAGKMVNLQGADGEPAFCAVGALQDANGKGEKIAKVALVLALDYTEIESETDDFEDPIIGFNDSAYTNYEDVSALWDKALRILR